MQPTGDVHNRQTRISGEQIGCIGYHRIIDSLRAQATTGDEEDLLIAVELELAAVGLAQLISYQLVAFTDRNTDGQRLVDRIWVEFLGQRYSMQCGPLGNNLVG